MGRGKHLNKPDIIKFVYPKKYELYADERLKENQKRDLERPEKTYLDLLQSEITVKAKIYEFGKELYTFRQLRGINIITSGNNFDIQWCMQRSIYAKLWDVSPYFYLQSMEGIGNFTPDFYLYMVARLLNDEKEDAKIDWERHADNECIFWDIAEGILADPNYAERITEEEKEEFLEEIFHAEILEDRKSLQASEPDILTEREEMEEYYYNEMDKSYAETEAEIEKSRRIYEEYRTRQEETGESDEEEWKEANKRSQRIARYQKIYEDLSAYEFQIEEKIVNQKRKFDTMPISKILIPFFSSAANRRKSNPFLADLPKQQEEIRIALPKRFNEADTDVYIAYVNSKKFDTNYSAKCHSAEMAKKYSEFIYKAIQIEVGGLYNDRKKRTKTQGIKDSEIRYKDYRLPKEDKFLYYFIFEEIYAPYLIKTEKEIISDVFNGMQWNKAQIEKYLKPLEKVLVSIRQFPYVLPQPVLFRRIFNQYSKDKVWEQSIKAQKKWQDKQCSFIETLGEVLQEKEKQLLGFRETDGYEENQVVLRKMLTELKQETVSIIEKSKNEIMETDNSDYLLDELEHLKANILEDIKEWRQWQGKNGNIQKTGKISKAIREDLVQMSSSDSAVNRLKKWYGSVENLPYSKDRFDEYTDKHYNDRQYGKEICEEIRKDPLAIWLIEANCQQLLNDANYMMKKEKNPQN